MASGSISERQLDEGRHNLSFPLKMTSESDFINHPYLHQLLKLNLSMEEIETLYYDNINMTMLDDYLSDATEGTLFSVPVSIIVLLFLLYGGISVAALIGNMLVLWIVTVSRKMRTVTNMFIANLALADITIAIFAIPFQFQAALLQRWNLPEFLCAFCPFVQVLSVNVSVFTLSAIALDRYRAVMHPLKARASKKKATWGILSIWFICVVLAFPTELDYRVIYFLERNGYDARPFCTNLGLSPTFRMYYNLSLVVIQYFFPLIIITGAYTLMARKLWGSSVPGNKEETRDAVSLRNKKKVIKMLALVVLLFAVCWLPLQMYYMFQTLFNSINEYPFINLIWFCSHLIAMGNSCCNPFIYAIYNDKFQREFRTRLRFIPLVGRLWNDSVWSEAAEIDTKKITVSYRVSTSRCFFLYLHNSHGHEGLHSHNNRMSVKQYKCNNHHHHCRNASEISVQSHIPPRQRNLFSVLENRIVRTISSPTNVSGTNLDFVQSVKSLKSHSSSTDNIHRDICRFCKLTGNV